MFKNKKISSQELNMADDIYGALLTDNTVTQRYIIIAVAALVFIFIIWAGFSKIPQVTSGEGKVIPSSQVQLIQSLDGGILEALYVKEGESVIKGQALVRIDDTRFQSNFAEQQQEINSLLANIVRLKAEINSLSIFNLSNENIPHDNWEENIKINSKKLKFSDEFIAQYSELVSQQQAEYQSRINNLSNQLNILAAQIKQKLQDRHELKSKIATLLKSHDLLNRELVLTQPLAKSGVVPEVELLKLERSVNELKGELSALNLKLPQIEALIDEVILKRREVALIFNSEVQAKLNELQTRLSRIKKAQIGAKDKVNKAVITSPVTGTIKTIHKTTIGSVVASGKSIIEIVPSEDQLLIETQIAPKDIAFLHPGLPAVVKVTAYDFTRYGGLEGRVEQISADTTVDDKGNSFYLIKVRTTDGDLIRNDGTPMPIIPGMLTTVDIVTGKRSILEYILNPILRAKDTALRER